jgi:hypothetical protein
MMLLALACVLAGGIGCGRPKPAARAEEITFRVDSTRLGERFEDAARSLTLSAPAHWAPLPAEAIEEGMRRLRAAAGPDSTREPRLLALYREDPEGASLAVSGFDRAFSGAALDSLGREHLTRLKARTPDGRVDQGRYSYRGFDVLQFRVVDLRAVHFKLLVNRPRTALLQLDYVVPRGVYERELESIESSIGSLRPLS